MSMLMAKDNGFQSALMAPTAILAEQHFKKISKHAEKLGMTVGLLVGGQRKAVRREVLEKIASGETDITIGTHNEFYDVYNLFIPWNFGVYTFGSVDDFMNGADPIDYIRSYSLQQSHR